MNNTYDSLNEVLEKLFEEAAHLAEEEIGRKLSENEGTFVPSERHKKQIEALFRRERRKERALRIANYAIRVACILLVCTVIAATPIMSVEAWRVKFMNFVFDSSAPGTEITFGDEKNNYVSVGNVTLHYVPEGFTESYASTEIGVDIKLESENRYIYFSMHDNSGQSIFDTENTTMEHVNVNGFNAVVFEKEKRTILIWNDDYYIYSIAGNIEKAEIIKIAENTEIRKK